ncbi:MAG TPA: DUF2911 domain-containing protein [Flavobacterium sp.]|jgi:hypothetical protein
MKIKNKLLLFILAVSTSFVFAQDKKPASTAETATGKINGATITISYGSPSVKGREIWGSLVPFDKVWRAGANNATTFETDKDITVNGSKLPAGKYSFFIIPNKNESTIIFNKVPDQWGAYKYEESKDQLRIKVKPQPLDANVEKLTYTVNQNSVDVVWEKWKLSFNIK